MFEALTERALRAAERRVAEHRAALAARMRNALPGGITAEASADGVRLSGRGARRRFALDPALRWLVETSR